MELSIDQKVAVITGGAGTLGLAVARCFLAEGGMVALLDLPSKAEEDSVVSLLSEFPGRSAYVALDLCDAGSIKRAAIAVMESFGAVHALIHNAAVFFFSPVSTWTDEAPLDRHYEIGIRGPIQLTREIWKRCMAARSGSVILISSIAGHVGEPDAFAYTPIKAAQKGLMLCYAQEMAPFGGWAVAISPGHIWSSVHQARARVAGKTKAEYERDMPDIQSTLYSRFLEPGEVARIVVLAASPAGRPLSGQDIHVTLGIEAGGFNRKQAAS